MKDTDMQSMQKTVDEIKAKLDKLLVSATTKKSGCDERVEKVVYISLGLDGLIEAFDEAYPEGT